MPSRATASLMSKVSILCFLVGECQVSGSPRVASKDVPGLVFSEVDLLPPAASYFPSAIPTSALVDFHHLIEGRLPGDQRPLSWQMTYDSRALQISRGQASDPRKPWVAPGKDLHKLQGKYR